jgi:hypothetical protein
MAIAKLLMTGLPDELFEDLSRSARTYLHFLSSARDSEQLTSRAGPFFDAVACGDDEAAELMAAASRPSHREGKEYEDDFLWIWFLMRWFGARAPREELDPLLARWEIVLEGNDDHRLDLCRAMLAKDQEAFDEALAELIAGHQGELSEAIDAEDLLPDDLPTAAKVWVELLALLRLASWAGLATRKNYPLAPSVARRTGQAKLPPADDWRTIDSYREME